MLPKRFYVCSRGTQGKKYYIMAKVSKKQLGRRRRTALLLLLALIAAAVYLLFFRSDSSRNAPTEETTAVLQSTAMTETTTTEEIGVLYQGTIPVQTELTVPTEPAVLTASQVELDAQPILQNPELPTGCEVTALTAALNYLGYPVDKLTMADQYLTRAEPYQATFGEAFIGSRCQRVGLLCTGNRGNRTEIP